MEPFTNVGFGLVVLWVAAASMAFLSSSAAPRWLGWLGIALLGTGGVTMGSYALGSRRSSASEPAAPTLDVQLAGLVLMLLFAVWVAWVGASL